MQCPNCAGPVTNVVNASQAMCSYCGAYFPTAAEPGSPDRVTWLAGLLDQTCPNGCGSLQNASVSGVACAGCPSCAGLMFQREGLQQAVSLRRSEYAGPQGTPVPVDQTALRHTRCCPCCDAGMEAHPYYGPGNSVIDSCHACGIVWLDGGELAEIERAPGRRVAAPVAVNTEPPAAAYAYGDAPVAETGNAVLNELMSLFR